MNTATKDSSDSYLKLKLDKYSDEINNQIQNTLMTDMMLKYAELSRQYEYKNKLLSDAEKELKKYNSELQEIVDEKVQEISESQIATIYALVKLAESRDDDTGLHIERTSVLCELTANLLSLLPEYMDPINQDFIDNISKASPLHDIGKVGIPDNILLKPGKLTNEEFEIMKTHTTIGYETLLEVHNSYKNNYFIKLGMEVARYHHEKWDGTGYPQGLIGKSIPVSARIMALVDVYDALRSKRVYKEPFSHKRTCEIIKEGSGKHFDPVIVEVFLANHEIFRVKHSELS